MFLVESFAQEANHLKNFHALLFLLYKKAKINSYKLLLYLLNLMTNPNETAILGYQHVLDQAAYFKNNNYNMNLRKLVGINGTFQDLQLQLVPLVISFDQKIITPWKLYLFKGRQLLGQFPINENGYVQRTYQFRDAVPAVFRQCGPKNQYSWQLYRTSPLTGLEQLEQKKTLEIKQSIQAFVAQLLEKQKQMLPIIREKGILKQDFLIELWKKVREDLTGKVVQFRCVLPGKKIFLSYKLSIKNNLDLQIERLNQQLKLTKSKSIKKRKNSLKSYSQIASNQNDSIKIHVTADPNDHSISSFQAPQKKFSLMSDIIQVSFDEQSSYRHDSAGHSRIIRDKLDSYQIGTTMILENQVSNTFQEPLKSAHLESSPTLLKLQGTTLKTESQLKDSRRSNKSQIDKSKGPKQILTIGILIVSLLFIIGILRVQWVANSIHQKTAKPAKSRLKQKIK